MKLLVCGGRDFADCACVEANLAAFGDDTELAHGAAHGADTLAALYGAIRGWRVHAFPADWAAHGKGAGPRRNQIMLDEFAPDIVVAFPGGKGTADMIRRARAAGIPVREIGRAMVVPT